MPFGSSIRGGVKGFGLRRAENIGFSACDWRFRAVEFPKKSSQGLSQRAQWHDPLPEPGSCRVRLTRERFDIPHCGIVFSGTAISYTALRYIASQ